MQYSNENMMSWKSEWVKKDEPVIKTLFIIVLHNIFLENFRLIVTIIFQSTFLNITPCTKPG